MKKLLFIAFVSAIFVGNLAVAGESNENIQLAAIGDGTAPEVTTSGDPLVAKSAGMSVKAMTAVGVAGATALAILANSSGTVTPSSHH